MPDPKWKVDTKKQRADARKKATKMASRDDEPKETGKQQREERIRREREVIHAFLNASGQGSAASNSWNDPPCYAIIGLGFSATVDHATLVQSKWADHRLGTLRIRHIGFDDPWQTYHPHNMNQELELLTLPGYKTQPAEDDTAPGDEDGADLYRWLKSTAFARINTDELNPLVTDPKKNRSPGKKQPLGLVRGSVTSIKWDKESKNYNIKLHKNPIPIKAARIDICTGPGQSRTKFKAPPALNKELITESNEVWVPRLYTATNITLENAHVAKGGLVLIRGGGAAVAQAVERALEGGADQILWVGKDINSSFPGTLRLDWLVQTANGALPPREDVPADDVVLLPTRTNLWIADGYDIESMEDIQEDDPRWKYIQQWADVKRVKRDQVEGEERDKFLSPSVLVTFARVRDSLDKKDIPKKDPKDLTDREKFKGGVRAPSCRDSEGAVLEELVYGLFHQVIVGTGLANKEQETGSAFGFSQDLGEAIEDLTCVRKTEKNKTLLVGLQTRSERIRWLGAAGHGSGFNNKENKDNLKGFEDTLPAQARIFQQGVTLSALTVAFANQWFLKYHKNKKGHSGVNHNVNTASQGELRLLVGNDFADKIHEMRIKRTRPFRSLSQVAQAIVYYEENKDQDDFLKKVVGNRELQVVEDDVDTFQRVIEVLEKIDGKLVVKYEAAKYPSRRF